MFGMLRALVAVAWLCALWRQCAALILSLDAHAEECFFDRVSSNTKLSLTFEVTEGGFLDIDVKVLLAFTHTFLHTLQHLSFLIYEGMNGRIFS